MKRMILCLLALMVLAGCVQTGEVQETTRNGATASSQADETPIGDQIQDSPSSTTIAPELKADIETKLEKGIKTVLPLNYRVMAYGDSFVFGTGIQNIKTKQYEFYVDVKFKKAYDRMTNLISVDEETMAGWIQTTVEPFDLAQNQKKVISIVMKVGDIKPGVRPKPGTYVFDITPKYKEYDTVVWDEYSAAMPISIKIE